MAERGDGNTLLNEHGLEHVRYTAAAFKERGVEREVVTRRVAVGAVRFDAGDVKLSEPHAEGVDQRMTEVERTVVCLNVRHVETEPRLGKALQDRSEVADCLPEALRDVHVLEDGARAERCNRIVGAIEIRVQDYVAFQGQPKHRVKSRPSAMRFPPVRAGTRG